MQDIHDVDINDIILGVSFANNMNRFIEYKTMIYEKKGRYSLIIASKMALSGGAFWILNRGQTVLF